MADKFDIDTMRSNRDAGTPGPLVSDGEQVEKEDGICEPWLVAIAAHDADRGCVDANARRIASVPAMEAEIERLCEQRENAAQAMAETASSWEQRCYSIMAALDQNFGEFEKNAPEVGSYYQVNLARKDAEIERLIVNQALAVEALEKCEKIQTRVQQDTYWRSPDNTLWPDLCDNTNNTRTIIASIKGDA